MTKQEYKVVKLPEIVGKGYKKFFESKHRYLVVKGGRGSKKSKTTALKMIYNIMKYPDTNGLVVRKVERTLRDSCFSELKWAIYQFGVARYWKITTSPMELIYLPTNQKILFRGMDDPLKLTSITVEKGSLNFVWIEEAYEVRDEDPFNKLDMSIRGKLPGQAYAQFIITFNPWSDKHWLKKKFFDEEDEDTLALTTTYECNEFLSEQDYKRFQKMKLNNPRRYSVEGLGQWGIIDGLIYENWHEIEFNYKDLLKNNDYELKIGLDFGYTNDPTALICCLVNEKDKEIYIFDEWYQKNMTNEMIATMIKQMGYAKDKIYADSSEPKSIDEIKNKGIHRIYPTIKGAGSVLFGIQKIQQYRLIVHPRCVNTLLELSTYCWDTKDNKQINKPIDMNNHLLDALRYAIMTEDKQTGVDTKRKVIY